MVLVLDIGNTRVKYALAIDGKVKQPQITSIDVLIELVTETVAVNPLISSIALCSVVQLDPILIESLKNLRSLFIVDLYAQLPFENRYLGETLGNDRIALVSGSIKNLEQDTLIIDAGTCITYDFVDHNKAYHGGGISPGLDLRYNALADYTSQLPRLEFVIPDGLTGNTTQTSIHSGVVNGFCHEIDGFINSYKKQYPGLRTLITGGSLPVLIKQLKSRFFAVPNLALEGTFALYEFNNTGN
ncbi:MAG: type III pantothenate kinase [Nonlabens sp.]